jgi:hypothetical protein
MRTDLRTTLFVAAMALLANVFTAYAVSSVNSDNLEASRAFRRSAIQLFGQPLIFPSSARC